MMGNPTQSLTIIFFFDGIRRTKLCAVGDTRLWFDKKEVILALFAAFHPSVNPARKARSKVQQSHHGKKNRPNWTDPILEMESLVKPLYSTLYHGFNLVQQMNGWFCMERTAAIHNQGTKYTTQKNTINPHCGIPFS